jgi:hypothetical protein
MKSLIIHGAVLALFVGLIAFRPWAVLHRQLGIQPPPKTLPVATAFQDTLNVENPALVLPPFVVDSLAKVVAQKEKQKAHFVQRLADLGEDTETVQKKVVQANKRYNNLVGALDRSKRARDSLLGERKPERVSKAATSMTPAGASPRYRGPNSVSPESRYALRGWKREDSATRRY